LGGHELINQSIDGFLWKQELGGQKT
jgi:hypothetical protein